MIWIDVLVYAAAILALVGVALGATALLRTAKTQQALEDVERNLNGRLATPSASTGVMEREPRQDTQQRRPDELRELRHELEALSRQVNAAASVAVGQPAVASATDPTTTAPSSGRQAAPQSTPTPAPTPAAPQAESQVVYLQFDDQGHWSSAAVSEHPLGNSYFQAELTSPTQGTLRLIPNSDSLAEILSRPLEHKSPALQIVQRGSAGQLVNEVPGRITRTADGGWRVEQPVQIVLA